METGLEQAEIDSLKDGKIDICDLLATKDRTSANKVKASLFFSTDQNDGYFKKESFTPWFTSLRDNERRNFKLMLEYMQNKQKLNSLPYIRTDKYGNKYMWLIFALAQSRQEFKVVMAGELDTFVKHYQLGLIVPDFDINQLFLEAQETNS
ncbi:hypothetical protein [Mucilaginibacter sp.]|uniref:hypothetical protein n=1 Tax=Mucilaginibacter sp. TaxID=1882438 RepID=UPI0025EF71C2|nr:hypothetical protein [Mucilaginibacter sp.]